jgi:hypothetical protein
MRRIFALLVTVAALAAVAALPAASSAYAGCPDDMMRVPDALAGHHVHDMNNNGFVCRKFKGINSDGTIDWAGGPDDNDLADLNWADDLP